MELRGYTPPAIAEELGGRLKQARLNRDMTQSEVAERAGLSRKAVLNAEKGQVRLEAFAAILAALDLATQLDLFLPRQDISPVQLARLKGKARRRASGRRRAAASEPPQW